MNRRWEWLGLAGMVAMALWLRLSHLHLLEFQADEAYAALLALDALRTGQLPLAGLMSSVGVTNPPLFAWLLIPMFAINSNPAFVSGCIAVLGVVAVVMTWHVGRKYYGPVTGLVAGWFFAVSPWAAIYSRKIWAQDFVPVFAAATIWALHAVACGGKRSAVFWCVLLPICVVQIHFSGLALCVAVAVILAVMRVKVDGRWAAGGLAAAVVWMAPYLYLQQQTGWADFRQARSQIGGGQQWEQLGGVTTHPITGYRLPSKQNVSYALAILNAGRIEDVLGIAAGSEFDRAGIWRARSRYFAPGVWDGLLALQRWALVAAVVWLTLEAWRARGRAPATILVGWLVLPVLVFYGAGLWTYLTYFAILLPAHFLVLGAAARKLPAAAVWSVTGALALANAAYLLEFYRFVDAHGGAQGTYGSGLGYKQQAARYLAEQGGEGLRQQVTTQLALARTRRPDEQRALVQKLAQPVLVQLNHEGRPELPQLEWPLLISQAEVTGGGMEPTEGRWVLVDANREAFPPALKQQLSELPLTNFGPIQLYRVRQ